IVCLPKRIMLWRGFPHSWKRAGWPLAVGGKQVELTPHLDKRREEGLPTGLGNADWDWAGKPVRFPPDTSDVEECGTLEFTTRLEVSERGHNLALQLRKWKSRPRRGRLVSEGHGHDLPVTRPPSEEPPTAIAKCGSFRCSSVAPRKCPRCN